MRHTFASDNYAGIHPEVLAAIAAANEGHAVSYGDDPVTARLADVVRALLGADAQCFPVFNGTGANVVALQAIAQRWESVICASSAHISEDEGGAPEVMAGLKLWTVPTEDGKLTPALVDTQLRGMGFVHHSQPAVVSIAQSTELGTVYTVDEVRALAEHAHARGLRLHMDGARLSNAAASQGVSLREITVDAGVDVLSLGGTKNGLMIGEAVVVLDPSAVRGVDFLRKTSMQLASKMRFVSAQLLALFEGDLWLRNAQHANAMAARLDRALRAIPGVEVPRPTQANAVFVRLPRPLIPALQDAFHFYEWDETVGEVRLMCSWDTTEQDVDALAEAIAAGMRTSA